MPKKIILTADDYGLSKQGDDAILKAVELGTVSSVQVLVNMASEADIKKLAKTISDSGNNCGIGLHVCTTAGKSVLELDNSLTQDGGDEFYSLSEMDYERLNSMEMANELRAQFEKLADVIGA